MPDQPSQADHIADASKMVPAQGPDGDSCTAPKLAADDLPAVLAACSGRYSSEGISQAVQTAGQQLSHESAASETISPEHTQEASR
jgi:hypothetical protein